MNVLYLFLHCTYARTYAIDLKLGLVVVGSSGRVFVVFTSMYFTWHASTLHESVGKHKNYAKLFKGGFQEPRLGNDELNIVCCVF